MEKKCCFYSGKSREFVSEKKKVSGINNEAVREKSIRRIPYEQRRESNTRLLKKKTHTILATLTK